MHVDSCSYADNYGHLRTRYLLGDSYRQDGRIKHRSTEAELLKATEVELPKCIAKLRTEVATKRKLPQRLQISK